MKSKKYCILTDSAAKIANMQSDIPENIIFYPLKIVIGDKEYTDTGGELTFEELYTFQQTNYIKTSQGSTYEFEELLKNLLKKYEIVYFFAMGSYFSGLVESVSVIINKYKNNVFLVKTNNIFLGTWLAIQNAIPLIELNKDINEIQKYTDDFIKKTSYYFVLSNNSYIFKSGRINLLTNVLTNMLKLKVIFEHKNGETKIIGKVRTLPAAWEYLLVKANDTMNSIPKSVAIMVDSSIDKIKVQEFLEIMKKSLQNKVLETSYKLSTLLLSHIGPEAFGCFIYPKNK